MVLCTNLTRLMIVTILENSRNGHDFCSERHVTLFGPHVQAEKLSRFDGACGWNWNETLSSEFVKICLNEFSLICA